MAVIGSLLYTVGIDRASIQALRQELTGIEQALASAGKSSGDFGGLTQNVRATTDTLKTMGAASDQLTEKARAMGREVSGLVSTFNATEAGGDVVIQRLTSLREQALALQPTVEANSKAYKEFGAIAGAATNGLEFVANRMQAIADASNPVKTIFASLQGEFKALNSALGVSGTNTDLVRAQLRALADTALQLRPAIEDDAEAFAQFNTLARAATAAGDPLQDSIAELRNTVRTLVDSFAATKQDAPGVIAALGGIQQVADTMGAGLAEGSKELADLASISRQAQQGISTISAEFARLDQASDPSLTALRDLRTEAQNLINGFRATGQATAETRDRLVVIRDALLALGQGFQGSTDEINAFVAAARAVNQGVTAFTTELGRAEAAADPIAAAYARITTETRSLVAQFRATGADADGIKARLQALKTEALALAEGVRGVPPQFLQMSTAAAQAQSGLSLLARGAKGVKDSVDPLDVAIKKLANEATGLRNVWQATGTDTQRVVTRLRELRDQALQTASGLDRTSDAYVKLVRSARQADATIAGIEGRMSRLGLASQVNLAAMQAFTGELSRFGPMGQVASASMSRVGTGLAGASVAAMAATTAIAGVGLAAAGLIRKGIPEVYEFQRAFNILRASGETDLAQIEQSLRTLRDEGGRAASVFSVAELAGSLAETVKAGVSAAEALQILEAGTKLAAAEGTELSETTGLLLENLRQFSLGADQAERAANAIAKASLAAAREASDLSEGLAVVGPVAAAAGFSLEETLAVLVELDNKGLDAADVGATALRSSLAAIVAPTKEALGVFEQLGVSLKDQRGNTRNLRDVLLDLRDALEQSGDAAGAAGNIFDTRAITAILALLHGDIEGLTSLIEDSEGAVDNYAKELTTGLEAAAKSASAELRTLAGDFVNNLSPGLEGALVATTDFIRELNTLQNRIAQFMASNEVIRFLRMLDRFIFEDTIKAAEDFGNALRGDPDYGTPAGELPPIVVEFDPQGFLDSVEDMNAAVRRATPYLSGITDETLRLGEKARSAFDIAADLLDKLKEADTPGAIMAARTAIEQFKDASETNKNAIAAVEEARRREEAATRAATSASKRAATAYKADLQDRRKELEAFIALTQTQVAFNLLTPEDAIKAFREVLDGLDREIANFGPLRTREARDRFLTLTKMRTDLANTIQAAVKDGFDRSVAGAKNFTDKIQLQVQFGFIGFDQARSDLEAAIARLESEIQGFGGVDLSVGDSMERLKNLEERLQIAKGALDAINDTSLDAARLNLQKLTGDADSGRQSLQAVQDQLEILGRGVSAKLQELQAGGLTALEIEPYLDALALQQQVRDALADVQGRILDQEVLKVKMGLRPAEELEQELRDRIATLEARINAFRPTVSIQANTGNVDQILDKAIADAIEGGPEEFERLQKELQTTLDTLGLLTGERKDLNLAFAENLELAVQFKLVDPTRVQELLEQQLQDINDELGLKLREIPLTVDGKVSAALQQDVDRLKSNAADLEAILNRMFAKPLAAPKVTATGPYQDFVKDAEAVEAATKRAEEGLAALRERSVLLGESIDFDAEALALLGNILADLVNNRVDPATEGFAALLAMFERYRATATALEQNAQRQELAFVRLRAAVGGVAAAAFDATTPLGQLTAAYREVADLTGQTQSPLENLVQRLEMLAKGGGLVAILAQGLLSQVDAFGALKEPILENVRAGVQWTQTQHRLGLVTDDVAQRSLLGYLTTLKALNVDYAKNPDLAKAVADEIINVSEALAGFSDKDVARDLEADFVKLQQTIRAFGQTAKHDIVQAEEALVALLNRLNQSQIEDLGGIEGLAALFGPLDDAKAEAMDKLLASVEAAPDKFDKLRQEAEDLGQELGLLPEDLERIGTVIDEMELDDFRERIQKLGQATLSTFDQLRAGIRVMQEQEGTDPGVVQDLLGDVDLQELDSFLAKLQDLKAQGGDAFDAIIAALERFSPTTQAAADEVARLIALTRELQAAAQQADFERLKLQVLDMAGLTDPVLDLRNQLIAAARAANRTEAELEAVLRVFDQQVALKRFTDTVLQGIQAVTALSNALQGILEGGTQNIIGGVTSIGQTLANLIPQGAAFAPLIGAAGEAVGSLVRLFEAAFDPQGPIRRAIAQGIRDGITSGFAEGFIAAANGEDDAQQQALDAIRASITQNIAKAFLEGALIAKILQPFIDELAAAALSGDTERINAAADAIAGAVESALPGILAAGEAVGGALDRIFGPSPERRQAEERRKKELEDARKEAEKLAKETDDFFSGRNAAQPAFQPTPTSVFAAPQFIPEFTQAVGIFKEAATSIRDTFQKGTNVNVKVDAGSDITPTNVRLA